MIFSIWTEMFNMLRTINIGFIAFVEFIEFVELTELVGYRVFSLCYNFGGAAVIR